MVVVPLFCESVKLELRTGQGGFGVASKELFAGMLVEREGGEQDPALCLLARTEHDRHSSCQLFPSRAWEGWQGISLGVPFGEALLLGNIF